MDKKVDLVTGATRKEYVDKKLKQNNPLPYKINCNHDVPYGGGTSKDGKTVYIDHHIPEFIKVKGKKINIHESIAVHEHAEFPRMAKHNDSYETAHADYANPAEKEYVERHGINWDDYNRAVEKIVRVDSEDTPSPNIPKDLYLKPYG